MRQAFPQRPSLPRRGAMSRGAAAGLWRLDGLMGHNGGLRRPTQRMGFRGVSEKMEGLSG